jgi:epoxyqueuosine reductase
MADNICTAPITLTLMACLWCTMKDGHPLTRADRIRRVAEKAGADLVGFADMRRLEGFFSYTDDLTKDRPYGICIAVGLDKYGRYDNSTEDDLAFPLLQDVAHRLKKEIERMGFSARIVMPDKRVSHNSPLYWRGEVSHKAAAKTAGLGWIGRSTLLVTPEFGPRVCLATVVTDMPLPTGRPMRNKCGSCSMCVASCHLRALKGSVFSDHPEDVSEAIDVKRCGALVNRTWADGYMCYECMLACPVGKKKGVCPGPTRPRTR